MVHSSECVCGAYVYSTIYITSLIFTGVSVLKRILARQVAEKGRRWILFSIVSNCGLFYWKEVLSLRGTATRKIVLMLMINLISLSCSLLQMLILFLICQGLFDLLESLVLASLRAIHLKLLQGYLYIIHKHQLFLQDYEKEYWLSYQPQQHLHRSPIHSETLVVGEFFISRATIRFCRRALLRGVS